MKYTVYIMLCILITACSAQEPSTSALTEADDVYYAPDFTMETLTGAPITLSEQQGRWIILNFWATDCAPCVEEMPELQAIAEDFADDLTILGINRREPASLVQPFVDDLGITFPILMHPDDSTLINYQVMALPQTIIVDPNGELVWRQFGPIELDSFSDTFTTLKAENVTAHQP